MRSTGWAIHHTSRVCHRLLLVGTGCLVVVSCLLAASAWRLAQGPIDVGWLSDRVRAALVDDTAPMSVTFGNLALAWEGFQKGVDYPLDLRVADISVTDPTGHRLVAAPDAHLTVSFAALLLGRFVPRTIEVDDARVAITREAAGPVNLGWETNGDDTSDAADGGIDLRQLQKQLTQPARSDRVRSHGLLDQLRRVHFRNAEMTLRDRKTNLMVHASAIDLDLVKARNGHMQGGLRASLALGDQTAALHAAVNLAPGSDSRMDMTMTAFRPSAVGALSPAFAILRQIDVPTAVTGSVVFDTALKLRHLEAAAQFGSGQIGIGQGTVPLRSGEIAVTGTMDDVAITHSRFDFAHSAEGAPEIVELGGSVSRVMDRFRSSLTINLQQIDLSDLPRLWPAGVGGSARPWVTEHITSGIASRGSASFVIEADESLRDVVLTKATGELTSSHTVFTWLDGLPPIDQAEVHLHLVDPDTLDIHVINGHQRISNRSADLLIKDGEMRIVGLQVRDQDAKIHLQLGGQIANALAFLGEPRLHLLSDQPIGLKTGGGDAAASIDVQFPLQADLQVDDVQIHADAHLTHVRLLDVVAGHALDDGMFDLGVNKDGLTFKGHGSLAKVAVGLEGSMDFTPGPADQIVQKVKVTGQPDASQLDAAGLQVSDVMSGPMGITAVLAQRRGGDASVAITGDLTSTALKIGPLAWGKPAGATASASAVLLLSRNRLAKIDRILLQGDNLLVTGSANLVDDRIRSVLLDRIRLGRTQGHGTIHITPGEVIEMVLQGSQIDLQPKITEKTPGPDTPKADSARTPVWTLDARFDQATLANGEAAANLLAKATGGGNTVRNLDVIGTTTPGPAHDDGNFSIRIEPRAGHRHLLVDARDAGRFIRAMDAIRGMQSGRLTIDAEFERPDGFNPVAGTAVINNVVVQNSPVLGKLLQGITVYGLVDALRGPGMAFSSIVIPFRDDGQSLILNDAHANNSSLGLTAMGRIGLSSGQASISGTIVPAYFFNSMLGQLPVVGKLFSPEKGGGIFAARFGVNGAINDPTITINPISALTPGFLRQIFSAFDSPQAGERDASPRPP